MASVWPDGRVTLPLPRRDAGILNDSYLDVSGVEYGGQDVVDGGSREEDGDERIRIVLAELLGP